MLKPDGPPLGGAIMLALSSAQPAPAVTARVMRPLPPLAAGKPGAAQLAAAPPFSPLHCQLCWPLAVVTWVAVPALHKFAIGAVAVAVSTAIPHTPAVGGGKGSKDCPARTSRTWLSGLR